MKEYCFCQKCVNPFRYNEVCGIFGQKMDQNVSLAALKFHVIFSQPYLVYCRRYNVADFIFLMCFIVSSCNKKQYDWNISTQQSTS